VLAPPILADQLQSLPPMLYIHDQNSISGCSKGSRGLSVPMRVSGIFTAATVSPSPSLRQRPSCYTIRAGRNLPDKEFRYLRTVIVTAAVYLAETYVFSKQSPGPFHCDPFGLPPQGVHLLGALLLPKLRSYFA